MNSIDSCCSVVSIGSPYSISQWDMLYYNRVLGCRKYRHSAYSWFHKKLFWEQNFIQLMRDSPLPFFLFKLSKYLQLQWQVAVEQRLSGPLKGTTCAATVLLPCSYETNHFWRRSSVPKLQFCFPPEAAASNEGGMSPSLGNHYKFHSKSDKYSSHALLYKGCSLYGPLCIASDAWNFRRKYQCMQIQFMLLTNWTIWVNTNIKYFCGTFHMAQCL